MVFLANVSIIFSHLKTDIDGFFLSRHGIFLFLARGAVFVTRRRSSVKIIQQNFSLKGSLISKSFSVWLNYPKQGDISLS